jgi:hypothetical protein
MKPNTKLALTVLWSPQPRWVEEELLQHVLAPGGNPGAIAPMTAYWRKQGYLRVSELETRRYLQLTTLGKQAVERAWPCLRQDDTQPQGWYILTFLQPPKGDRNFRYLRTQVLDQGAVMLSRGVYLLAEHQATAILTQINQHYSKNVVVLRVVEERVGDMFQVIDRIEGVSDLMTAYSGISKEIDQLLAKSSVFSLLTYQQKNHIASVFHRMYSLMQKDRGWGAFFRAGRHNITQLLQMFHSSFYEPSGF